MLIIICYSFCQQLKHINNCVCVFHMSGSVFYDTSIQYGTGTGPVLLSNVKCTGLESRLIDCKHSLVHVSPCSNYYDIGIKCEG